MDFGNVAGQVIIRAGFGVTARNTIHHTVPPNRREVAAQIKVRAIVGRVVLRYRCRVRDGRSPVIIQFGLGL